MVRAPLETVRTPVLSTPLFPVALGTLGRGERFPIVAERLGPDGVAQDFSTEHWFDAFGQLDPVVPAGDGSVWFAPSIGAGGIAGFGDHTLAADHTGRLLTVAGDGTAWLAAGGPGNDGLASISKTGTITYFHFVDDGITRIVASEKTLLIFDGESDDVYRVDESGSIQRLGSFPQFAPRDAGTIGVWSSEDRGAMWGESPEAIWEIPADGETIRRYDRGSLFNLLGDDRGVWANLADTRRSASDRRYIGYLRTDGELTEIPSDDGTRGAILSDGGDLIEAHAERGACSGEVVHADARIEDITLRGSGPLCSSFVAEHAGARFVFGLGPHAFATVDENRNVRVTGVPRP